jgi:hypothetical protein
LLGLGISSGFFDLAEGRRRKVLDQRWDRLRNEIVLGFPADRVRKRERFRVFIAFDEAPQCVQCGPAVEMLPVFVEVVATILLDLEAEVESTRSRS